MGDGKYKMLGVLMMTFFSTAPSFHLEILGVLNAYF